MYKGYVEAIVKSEHCNFNSALLILYYHFIIYIL